MTKITKQVLTLDVEGKRKRGCPGETLRRSLLREAKKYACCLKRT